MTKRAAPRPSKRVWVLLWNDGYMGHAHKSEASAKAVDAPNARILEYILAPQKRVKARRVK